jgi:hypothetical protein
VLDVVFPLEGSDVRATEGLSAFVAEKVESAEVVGLAERVLARWLVGDREEFGGYNLAAVLDNVSWFRVRVGGCSGAARPRQKHAKGLPKVEGV